MEVVPMSIAIMCGLGPGPSAWGWNDTPSAIPFTDTCLACKSTDRFNACVGWGVDEPLLRDQISTTPQRENLIHLFIPRSVWSFSIKVYDAFSKADLWHSSRACSSQSTGEGERMYNPPPSPVSRYWKHINLQLDFSSPRNWNSDFKKKNEWTRLHITHLNHNCAFLIRTGPWRFTLFVVLVPSHILLTTHDHFTGFPAFRENKIPWYFPDFSMMNFLKFHNYFDLCLAQKALWGSSELLLQWK